MGLKILHSADWHLDSPFTGFAESQRSRLRNAQRKIPEKIVDLCLRENCDMMLLAGDLFDGEPCREFVELVKKELHRSGVPVLIAPGNHDYCGPGSPWLEESWPENVFIFSGELESVTIQGLNCRIYGAGYRSMDCLPLLEGFQAQGEEKYCVAVLHGDPVQSRSPYCPITSTQVRLSGLDYLALGHIHKAGAFRAGRTLCAWPGCPMGRGWDETGEKGVCIVTLEDGVDIQAVSLDTLRFQELEVDTENNAAESLEAVLPAVESQDFFRISLTGSAPVDLKALKKHFSWIPNLELLDNTEPPLDIWGDADEDSLEGLYFQMLRKAMELNPEQADRVRQAAEISRKILTGREVTL